MQEAQRRLRPVRLKVELEADQGSSEGSFHAGSASTAAANAVSAVDTAGNGGRSDNRAPHAALQQALSHVSIGSGGSTASQQPSSSDGSILARHVPGLHRITTNLHLRHTISRANPFRAVHSLTGLVDTSGTSSPSVIYEVGLRFRDPCWLALPKPLAALPC